MDKLTGTNDAFDREILSANDSEQTPYAERDGSTEPPKPMTYRQLQTRDEALISQLIGGKELDREISLAVETPDTDLLRLKEESYFPDNLPWQFRSPMLRWGRKVLRTITGKQSVNILRLTDIAYSDNNNPVTGHLDYPHPNISIDGAVVTVIGWVLGMGETQPKSVILAVDKQVFAEVPIDQLRPGVSEAYCLENSDHKWGFCAVLSIKDLPDYGVILAQAHFTDGLIVPISAVSFYK